MRYKFARDDDCHWYLIPCELESKFYALLEDGEDDNYVDFCNKFDQYRCNGQTEYTFTDPR